MTHHESEPVLAVQRFSNTQVGSEPLGKSSTLFLFSTGYKFSRFDPFCLEMIRSDPVNLYNFMTALIGHSVSERANDLSFAIEN